MKKKIFILVGIVAIIGAGAFLLLNPEKSKSLPVGSTDGTVVTLTADGFSPSEITIPVGGTITFRSTTGKLFWPASDLHPSHLLYADFDPKKPVEPEASWSFTFTKAGMWRFHDHLAPYYTGTVTVTE
ncbi:MAG: hypothetical protein AB199_04410 [Parcubacteria bacterium C7867-004]|nr:MAG: hypothetical protein AB199_04410 [Parcubacteria bacterium C7867-004]